MNRILGKIDSGNTGPLVIFIAGIHGNEAVGVHAFNNVYSSLLANKIPFQGTLIGIAGNLIAIMENRRFIDYDLNRRWSQEYLDKILTEDRNRLLTEDLEMLEICEAIDNHTKKTHRLKVIVDLHATSSDKGNFIVAPQPFNNHPIIEATHLPVVVDLENYIHGTTLVSYYQKLGYVAFVVEGGILNGSDSIRLHTSSIWEILEDVGCISFHDHFHEDHYVNQLIEVSKELPKKVKTIYRHPIKPGDGFRMLPGFNNFQQIKKNQLIAMDAIGPIRSPLDGAIFMPLYQTEGDDGYFIVEEVES